MTDQTLFQQLIADSAVEQMINDLSDLEQLTPEGESVEDVDGWELAFRFTEDDVPRMLEELREMRDEE